MPLRIGPLLAGSDGVRVRNAAEFRRGQARLPCSRPRTSTATLRSRSAGRTRAVASILSNPDQDPHLFEASPSVARALAAARIVVVQRRRLRSLDGQAARAPRSRAAAGRSWSADLVAQEAGRQPASLVRPGDHAGLCAARSSAALAAADPAHKADYDAAPGARSSARSSRFRRKIAAHAGRDSRARRSPRRSRCSATWPPRSA